MTEHGTSTAGHHRGQRASLVADMAVADGVHATMQAVQAADAQRVVQRVARDPQIEHLRQRHHAPLPIGECRERQQRGWAAFVRTIPTNAAHPLSMATNS
jgi:hypothetical protein